MSETNRLSEPKIGLALGSGGARGFAHLGVIKALREEDIPIHMIAGSSMGALIGTFYGANDDISKLYKIATGFRRKYYLDFTVPKMGFISGNRVKELIRIFTKGKKLEELRLPVHVVATDLLTGEKVVFKDGPIHDAVRASISIPGIFVPERVGGRLLIDGGVVDRVPVSVSREMGADIVIAVDVAHFRANPDITSIFDVIIQSIDIMQDELVRTREIETDIMIRPKVEKYSAQAFTNTEEIIRIGENEARNHIEKIKNVIKNWKESQDGKS